MKKVVPEHIISNCHECAECRINIPTGLYYCKKAMEYTSNVGIPQWCPLESINE